MLVIDQGDRQSARLNSLRSQPGRAPSTDPGVGRNDSPAIKNEVSTRESQSKPGSSFPEVRLSNIDIDAKPIYDATGKPITNIDMDAGMPIIASFGV